MNCDISATVWLIFTKFCVRMQNRSLESTGHLKTLLWKYDGANFSQTTDVHRWPIVMTSRPWDHRNRYHSASSWNCGHSSIFKIAAVLHLKILIIVTTAVLFRATVQRRHFGQWLGSRPGALWSETRKTEVWGQKGWQWERVWFLGRGSTPPSPPAQLRGLEERCKLAQWSPRQSSVKCCLGCISDIEKSSNLDISQLVGRFQLLELCKKFTSIVGEVHRLPQRPLNDAPATVRVRIILGDFAHRTYNGCKILT